MLKKAKWVRSDQAEAPVSHIARSIVPQRLDAVWPYARLAALDWKKDEEYVHQMRVATRRASAAIDTFAETLPRKRAQRITKMLKKLRQAAGEARDLDVLANRLQTANGGAQQLGAVLRTIAKRRKAAQKPVRGAYKRLAREGFPRQCSQLAKRIHWRSPRREPTYAQSAQLILLRVVNDFLAAAAADLEVMKNLHALRIEGKRLRYSLELLSGALDRTARDEVYPRFKALQQDLGEIVDHDVARRTLKRWSKIADGKPARKKLLELASAEQAARQSRQGEFLERWTGQQLEELEDLFRGLIGAL